jgi:hypothetical protein
MKYSIVIPTVNRSQKNYLNNTIANLARSGVFHSPLLGYFAIFNDSTLDKGGCNENSLRCLKEAQKQNTEWTIFLEDDVDVINNFLESVDAWLNLCYDENVPLYSLSTNYVETRQSIIAWKYPIERFYGTQGYCIHKNRINSLIQSLETTTLVGLHDMRIKEWGICYGFKHFLASCPSFIQHLGDNSSIHEGRFHTICSWPGTNYNFLNRSCIFNKQEQNGDNFYSNSLATLLENYFDKEFPVYDFGCGLGKYIQYLETQGFTVQGFEGTPGITELSNFDKIKEFDLICPLVIDTPGNVMSIEVIEHIPSQFEHIILNSITSACNNRLVLSWAIPNQGGTRHINEQNSDYVIEKLNAKGFGLNHDLTEKFRNLCEEDFFWFKKSIYVFEKHLINL